MKNILEKIDPLSERGGIFTIACSILALLAAVMYILLQPGVFKMIAQITALVFLFAIFAFYALGGLKLLVGGMHNYRQCGNELFDELDRYKMKYYEGKKDYFRMIKVVKCYYKPDGEVDCLFKEKNFEAIFGRLEFLEKQEKYYGLPYEIVSGVGISLVATLLWTYFMTGVSETNDSLVNIIIVVILFFLILLILLIPYYVKGRSGSYSYMVDRYEMELLEKRLNVFYAEIEECTNAEANFIKIQVDTIKMLHNKTAKLTKKEKEHLRKIICKVQDLDFHNVDLSEYNNLDYEGTIKHLLDSIHKEKYTGTEGIYFLKDVIDSNNLFRKQ